ncbi:hypothetical protein HZ326_2638 [Fusarium oxysporum f. sp. albedinis]|nr:hypothetical protein HZ326_2638 [Fusarium oxysporum f. sp. albedinis]
MSQIHPHYKSVSRIVSPLPRAFLDFVSWVGPHVDSIPHILSSFLTPRFRYRSNTLWSRNISLCRYRRMRHWLTRILSRI